MNFMKGTTTHKDLLVWQKSMALAVEIHRATQYFPPHELYGMTSQMRRAAVSIPSNIAEGHGRQSNKELLRFLYIALGSLAELETQIILAHQFNYLSESHMTDLTGKITELVKMMTALIKRIDERV